MNTPFSKYINALTIAYQNNWEDLESIDNVIECFNNFKSSENDIRENLHYFAFKNKMFIFQNPIIPDIVNEFMKDDLYKQYKNGNEKIFGALIGKIIKKYPSCDINKVRTLLINS